jgi:hypothetical protein
VLQGGHQEKDISLRKHVGLVPDLSIDFKKKPKPGASVKNSLDLPAAAV